MANIAIIGGHGQIALLLTRELKARGDDVVSFIRNVDHSDAVREAGGRPVIADLEKLEMEDFARYLAGVDAVVFAAGAGAGSTAARKRTVDYGASLLAARAAAEMNVPRFIQISAIGVDEPLEPDTEAVWAAYVEAKRDADAALRLTALNWTILRPGGLTDEPATGRVRLGTDLLNGSPAPQTMSIPRADVAAVIAGLLSEPEAVDVTWDVLSGEQPISAAIAAALEDRA